MTYKKSSWFILAFLLLLLLFTRFSALFRPGAIAFFPNFEGLYRGWLAKNLLDGAGAWSIFEHPHLPAEGGSVVVGYIAALFFSLFGDNIFSLMLIPITFSLLILATFYLFLERYFSRIAAMVFSFLFIFTPKQFFNFSGRIIGFHFEAILFSILGAFCFFEIFFNQGNCEKYVQDTPTKKLSLYFIAFGIISGFGIYFFYTYFIMISTIILFWFIIDKRFLFKKYFLIFFLGCIIGLLPWLVYNIRHSFAGLKVHGLSPFEIVFSKNLLQILQTFWIIVSRMLPWGLGTPLYQIAIFSFGIIIFSNTKSFRRAYSVGEAYPRNMRGAFFIVYAFMFLSIWSILYIPLSKTSGHPDWLSGLCDRLFHLYPFLFVPIGLCVSIFFPRKKETKRYFLKMGFCVILLIWLSCVGVSNYAEILSVPAYKANAFKIKGYSVRMAYLLQGKRIVNFLDRDIIRVGIDPENSDVTLAENFVTIYPNSLYTESKECHNFLQTTLSDPRSGELRKIHYSLIAGLNTGDSTEGYNILLLNNLISQKINPAYRHYLYEGVAVSVMNRRRGELIKNIDFINTIPIKYRHYFLLELGRVISSYPDVKTREEKLHYVLKKFSPVFGSCIYRGFAEARAIREAPDEETPKSYWLYYYRAVARNVFVNLPEERDISGWLARFNATGENDRYFYWGMVEALFKDVNLYQEEAIKSKIKTIISSSWEKKDFLCEGLGLTLGFFAFGDIKRFSGLIESSLSNEQLRHFYYGYCLSLKERYGIDAVKIKKLIDGNVDRRFVWPCYKIIWSQRTNAHVV